jgi:hypothetical protein
MFATFGRPNRETICERDPAPDIVQTLHLISGDTINKKITQWKPDSGLNDEQQLDRIYLTSLSRHPGPAERQAVQTALAKQHRREVYQDVLWAILNSKEFMYIH